MIITTKNWLYYNGLWRWGLAKFLYPFNKKIGFYNRKNRFLLNNKQTIKNQSLPIL